ncbi:MAG TPA: ATP-binding cassette domain-containing protein [Opitutaceae bacterium]
MKSVVLEPLLQVSDLHQAFAGRAILTAVNLSVRRGSVVSVFGRSGAGKSVFLKCVAGLLAPDRGTIRFNGSLVGAVDRERHRTRDRIGYVFQGNALLDSLTALENVALPLAQTTNLPSAEIEARAVNALDRLGLAVFKDHFPNQLSGGMQKRVALARALVSEPELLLFDEPTAGLDPRSRNAVFAMIAHYRRAFGFTALIVTHDVVEALEISDRVALLGQGALCFEGTPADFRRSGRQEVIAMRESLEDLSAQIARIDRGGSASAEGAL